MQTIAKSQVANWILLDLLSKKQRYFDKVEFFQRKYGSKFEIFEEEIKTKPEDFEIWDDYIEWKANHDFYTDVLKKLEEVKNGDFQMD